MFLEEFTDERTRIYWIKQNFSGNSSINTNYLNISINLFCTMKSIETINEGSAKIKICCTKKISKKMPVFYNPVMKFNRDVSVILLNALNNLGKKEMKICLPLAGSGIRGIRFLKELNKGVINKIHFNDYKKDFIKMMKENLRLSGIKKDRRIHLYNHEANLFLFSSKGFDYIDIDPFGTPNPFLDSAVRRISREGILAVTATDTSALTGTYPLATKRKYFSVPMRNFLMHEIGLRILTRKIQLIGAQNDKALIPIFSYAKEHYYRIFLRCEKGKSKVDEILKHHKYFIYCNKCMSFFADDYNKYECTECRKCKKYKKRMEFAGPLWTGELFDKRLTKEIKCMDYKSIIGRENRENINFLEILLEESAFNNTGFYDVHEIVSRYKIKTMPTLNSLIEKIKQSKHKAARTHFSRWGIKSDIKVSELIRIMKEF